MVRGSSPRPPTEFLNQRYMRRKIVLEYGDIAKIAKLMGCTPEMVSKSVNFKKNSLLARKIRFVALKQFGGVEVGE